MGTFNTPSEAKFYTNDMETCENISMSKEDIMDAMRFDFSASVIYKGYEVSIYASFIISSIEAGYYEGCYIEEAIKGEIEIKDINGEGYVDVLDFEEGNILSSPKTASYKAIMNTVEEAVSFSPLEGEERAIRKAFAKEKEFMVDLKKAWNSFVLKAKEVGFDKVVYGGWCSGEDDNFLHYVFAGQLTPKQRKELIG